MTANEGLTNKNRNRKFTFGLIAFIFFLLIYFLNTINPLWGDDFRYSFVDTENFQPINGFSDILQSQYKHYFEWGGRTIVHIIAQFLLMLDIRFSHLLNSIVYMLFVFCIYKYINKDKEPDPRLFLFVNLLVFVAQYPFYSTAIWLIGSANYLWGTSIIITFLYPYYSYFVTNKERDGVIKSLLFFLLGIVAGWTNENTSVAMIFIIIALFFYLRKYKTKIPLWYIAGLAGACIGCFMMIKAPGNYVRYELIMKNLDLVGKPLDLLLFKAPRLIFRYLTSMLPLVASYFTIYHFFARKEESNKNSKHKIQFSLILFIAAHVGFLAMIAAPSFPARATFGIVSLMVVSIGLLFSESDINGRWVNKRNVILLLTFLFVIFYIQRLYYISYISDSVNKRISIIEESKRQNIVDIVFDKPIVLPKEYTFDDLEESPEAEKNHTFSRYYKIRSVKVIRSKDEEQKQ